MGLKGDRMNESLSKALRVAGWPIGVLAGFVLYLAGIHPTFMAGKVVEMVIMQLGGMQAAMPGFPFDMTLEYVNYSPVVDTIASMLQYSTNRGLLGLLMLVGLERRFHILTGAAATILVLDIIGSLLYNSTPLGAIEPIMSLGIGLPAIVLPFVAAKESRHAGAGLREIQRRG